MVDAVTAIRTEGEPMHAGAFVVPSKSAPGATWTVLWITEGTAHCFCPAFQHRGTCRHVAEVAHAIEIEARGSLETATPASKAAAGARLAELEREFSL